MGEATGTPILSVHPQRPLDEKRHLRWVANQLVAAHEGRPGCWPKQDVLYRVGNECYYASMGQIARARHWPPHTFALVRFDTPTSEGTIESSIHVEEFVKRATFDKYLHGGGAYVFDPETEGV